jgi:hypothetical protein
VLSLLSLALVAPQAGVAKTGGGDRPLKGKGTQTVTFSVATTPFPASLEGTARVSHLGKSTITSSFTILLTGPSTFSVAGTATIVAANGDQLFTSFTGTGQSTGAFSIGQITETTAIHTLTGGTGRFTDASGTFTAFVSGEIVSIVGLTATSDQTYKLQGKISY